MLNQRFYYWYLPILVIVPLLVMYYSGIPQLVGLVCPPINREFGLPENFQLLVLVGIFVISIMGAIRKTIIQEKAGWAFLAFFSIFIFLEEIDYGAHHLAYFYGHKNTLFSDLTGAKNVHNVYGNPRWYKRPVYPIIGLFFMVLPFYREKINHALLRYLVPKKLIVGTAIIGVFVNITPRLIQRFELLPDGGLGIDIGEFFEIMIYYIFALYIYELVFEKNYVRNHSYEKAEAFTIDNPDNSENKN